MSGHTRDTGGRALLKAPFNRELLRSVRSTDGEGALPDRGSLASGSRFLLITMNVIIDSVDTPPPEEESYLSLGSILLKTRQVFISGPHSVLPLANFVDICSTTGRMRLSISTLLPSCTTGGLFTTRGTTADMKTNSFLRKCCSQIVIKMGLT
jgi:hypothetical protein